MILPAIVRECTVRFGHAMRVFPLLDRIAAIVRCIQQFTRQPSRHSGFTTRASGSDEPTNSQRRSEEHTSELQSLMRISYAVFCLKKKKQQHSKKQNTSTNADTEL